MCFDNTFSNFVIKDFQFKLIVNGIAGRLVIVPKNVARESEQISGPQKSMQQMEEKNVQARIE